MFPVQKKKKKPNRSMNRERERFKVFKIGPGSNRDDVIINLIII